MFSLRLASLRKKLLTALDRFAIYKPQRSPIAQLVEQVTVNHRVRGSSPRWGASKGRTSYPMLRPFFVSKADLPDRSTFVKKGRLPTPVLPHCYPTRNALLAVVHFHPHPVATRHPSPCDARKASLQGEGNLSERSGYLVRHNSEQNFVSVRVEVVTIPRSLGLFLHPLASAA